MSIASSTKRPRENPMPATVRAMNDTAATSGESTHRLRYRYRAIFISDIHLGTPGCQADALLDFLRRTESRAPVPRRRHHRRLAAEAPLVLAAGAQRRRPEAAAQGAQGHDGRSTFPATTTRSRATSRPRLRRHRRFATRPCTRPPTAGGCSSCTATSSTASSSARAGWPSGRRALHADRSSSTAFNALRARLGLPYWSLSQFLKHRSRTR